MVSHKQHQARQQTPCCARWRAAGANAWNTHLESRFLAIHTLCKHALDFAGAPNAAHSLPMMSPLYDEHPMTLSSCDLTQVTACSCSVFFEVAAEKQDPSSGRLVVLKTPPRSLLP